MHVYTDQSWAGTPCDDLTFVTQFHDSMYAAAIGQPLDIHYMFLGLDSCQVESAAGACDIDYTFDDSWNHLGSMGNAVNVNYFTYSIN